jgi:large subunit ribosomal protein L10
MSKKVKNLITGELTNKMKSLENVAVINPRGIDGIKNNLLRRRLREKGLRMTVVKNSLARRAAVGTKLVGFDKLLDGPSAIIHGNVSVAAVARLLIEEKKKNEKLEVRGLFFDGEIYEGEKGIETASKLPTREEAIANLIGMILGPGRKLAGAIKGPGGKLGAVLKTIEDKAKEKEAAGAAPAPAAG